MDRYGRTFLFLEGGLFLHHLMVPRLLLNHLRNDRGEVRFDEPLAAHTTIGVGGSAVCHFTPDTVEALVATVRLCRHLNYPYLLLGGGSNLLCSDDGFPGLIISTQGLREIIYDKRRVRAEAGTPLPLLLDTTRHLGNSSLDFLAGIPGTLGGAIAMNAGIPEQSISDMVEEVAVLDENSKVQVLTRTECQFGYRQSKILKERLPVLWGCLRFNGKLYDHSEVLAKRRATQPLDLPSAGCVFKNPPGKSAGLLIEKAGLKGLIVGKAKVSEKHANFVVNLGGATNAEIRKLIDIVRQKVYKSFHLWLELEIEVLDGCERGNRVGSLSSGPL